MVTTGTAFVYLCFLCLLTTIRCFLVQLPINASPSQLHSKSKNRDKEELDGLLTGIGLTPVPKKNRDRQQSKETRKKGIKKANKVSIGAQLDYARNGHAVLRDFIDPKTLHVVRKKVLDYAKKEELKAWKQKVQVATNSATSCNSVEACRRELESLGIRDIPFLQFFNTWTSLPEVKKLAFDLGEVASTLLDVPRIRLYQDSIFWKRTEDGPTPWHVDAKMAPFDTSHLLTLWIPLNDIPKDGTGLIFVSKSHSDFALPYWNPIPEGEGSLPNEWERLEERYAEQIVNYMPLKIGDITAHSGWTLHCANDNNASNDRLALAISYVDANAQLRADALDDNGKGDNEDQNSYKKWAKSVPPRTNFEHELAPIVFDYLK